MASLAELATTSHLDFLVSGDGEASPATSDDDGPCAASQREVKRLLRACADARRDAARRARAEAAAREDLERWAADAASARAALAEVSREAAQLRSERDVLGYRLGRVEATLRAERDAADPLKRTLLKMSEASNIDARAAREATLKLQHELDACKLELRQVREALGVALTLVPAGASRRLKARRSFFRRRSSSRAARGTDAREPSTASARPRGPPRRAPRRILRSQEIGDSARSLLSRGSDPSVLSRGSSLGSDGSTAGGSSLDGTEDRPRAGRRRSRRDVAVLEPSPPPSEPPSDAEARAEAPAPDHGAFFAASGQAFVS